MPDAVARGPLKLASAVTVQVIARGATKVGDTTSSCAPTATPPLPIGLKPLTGVSAAKLAFTWVASATVPLVNVTSVIARAEIGISSASPSATAPSVRGRVPRRARSPTTPSTTPSNMPAQKPTVGTACTATT